MLIFYLLYYYYLLFYYYIIFFNIHYLKIVYGHTRFAAVGYGEDGKKDLKNQICTTLGLDTPAQIKSFDNIFQIIFFEKNIWEAFEPILKW